MSWSYEADEEPKRRHHWGRPEPGFITLPTGERIGKCPCNLSLAEAEQALNEGLHWSPEDWARTYPKKIWCIFEGFLYRAEPTNPGRSYHAFPEDPAERQRIPWMVRKQLRERARLLGCSDRLKPWLDP